MEEKDIEKINDKLVDIITLLAFIDSKLGVIVSKMPTTVEYQSVVTQNHTGTITCSNQD